MLLARGALCRLGADVPKTCPHDMPQLARLLRRTLLARNAAISPAARALSRAYTSALHARRSYATTARATKPTATVKKAVKAAVAKKPAPKTRAALAKKAAPAKKPARKPAKKTVAKKPAAKKPAAKKPAAKKAAAKKAVPRKRVKKVLSPEEKEKATIRELRVKALKAPVSQLPVSAYNVFVGEKAKGTGGDPQSKVADAARDFKLLTPAEHEHYNHLAIERSAAKKTEFQAWLHSYTADEIRIANNARNQLRKKLAGRFKTKPAHTGKLHDDRVVKRLSPYNLFLKDRHASGDFKGIKPTEACGLISSEWKTLSAGEKKKYQDDAQVMIAARVAA